MLRPFYLIFAVAFPLGAQTPLAGPSLGFVYDKIGHAVRPILGVPGASTLGDSLTSSPVSAATLSFRQNVAIFNDGAWKAVTLSSTPATTVLPGGLAGNLAAVSETGVAAAFYDSANTALTVVTGIASGSMAANPVALDGLPGPITAIAIADDGSLLLSSSLPTGGESLYWIAAGGGAHLLAGVQSTASILLWNQGANALVTDRAANQVLQIQNPGTNAAVTPIASSTDGLTSPSAAALSADSRQLWIANAGAHSVLGINLATRAAVTLNCTCDVTTLTPLAGSSTYRLNDPKYGPLWLLDPSPDAPRIVFVPPVQAIATTQEADQ